MDSLATCGLYELATQVLSPFFAFCLNAEASDIPRDGVLFFPESGVVFSHTHFCAFLCIRMHFCAFCCIF